MIEGPMSPESNRSDGAPEAGLSGDRFSAWSVILILLVVGFQLLSNDGQAFIDKVFHSAAATPTHSVSTDSFEQLVQIDLLVKTAYAESLLPSNVQIILGDKSNRASSDSSIGGVPLSPFHKSIKRALNLSLSALSENPSSTELAQRVIFLRPLLAIPSMAAIPGRDGSVALSSPLAAFDRSIANDPDNALRLKREETFLEANFSSEHLPPAELSAQLTRLSQFPTLLFYGRIARQELEQKAGSYHLALQANHSIEEQSASSLGFMGLLATVMILFVAVAVVILIGCLSIVLLRYDSGDPSPMHISGPFDRFMTPVQKLIADEDRKLRPRHLLDCFAIYLATLIVIGTAFGYGVNLLPLSMVRGFTSLQAIYVSIGIAVLSYVGASSIALAVLAHTARKVKASLAQELGLSPKSALRHAGYGLVCWSISLALMMAILTLTQSLFHSLPNPENPAMPLLSFAPTTVARLILYALVAISAPFFEETFFRGVFLNAMLLKVRPVWACLLTGIMFGGIHPVGISGVLALATLGTVFAWIAYLRKSLVPSMVAHCLQNSYVFFTLYLGFAAVFNR